MGYYKNFSEKNQIHFYNFKSKKNGITNIKNISSEDYFYSKEHKDVVENIFNIFETSGIKIINQVIDYNSITFLDNISKQSLLDYILIQHLRTPYSIEVMQKYTEYFWKQHIQTKQFKEECEKDNVDYDFIVKNTSFKLKNFSGISMLFEYIKESKDYPIEDLNIGLYINKTDINFITNDNPVIFINPCYDRDKSLNKVGTTGLKSPGLVILFVLSPVHLIIAYDKNIYENFIIRKIYHKSYINHINYYLVLHSSNNIYSKNSFLTHELDKFSEIFEKYKTQNKVMHEEMVSSSKIDNEIREIIRFTLNKNDYNPNIGLKIINFPKFVFSRPNFNKT